MDAVTNGDSDPTHISLFTDTALTLSNDVLLRFPGLDELDQKLLDQDFSPLAFVDSQLTNMSATQLREMLQVKLKKTQEQIDQFATTTNANLSLPSPSPVPSVDVSKINELYSGGCALVSRAEELDDRLTATRNRLIHILHLRETLMTASSTLVLCRLYISKVSSLPPNVERALSDLSSITQRIVFIKLIEKRIEAYASIPAINTCIKQFSSYTNTLLNHLPPVQSSLIDDCATFWTEAMPHIALGTVLHGHKSLAEIVIDQSQIFSSNPSTGQGIHNNLRELALSTQRFQQIIDISTPYLSKLESIISQWIKQAHIEFNDNSRGLFNKTEIDYNTSVIITFYEAYLNIVLKNLTRLLKVTTIDNDNANEVLSATATAFVTFEMDLRRSTNYDRLAALFPELKKPISSGLFVPLFSSFILSNLDSNISKLKSDALNTMNTIDFSCFNTYNAVPPSQIVFILKAWNLFLQQISAFLDNNTKLYVSETVIQSMQELAKFLLEQLRFQSDINPILQKKYSQIGVFPVQHSLLTKSPCKQITIYNPSELLIVALVPRVISTIYCVLWSINIFENNVPEMLLSHLSIICEETIDGPKTESNGREFISYNYDNECTKQRELFESLQQTWNTVSDTAMRTLAGVMAGELCAIGVYPLLDEHGNGKQEFRRVQSLLTSQLELFLDTFKTTPFPSIFAETLTPTICNAVGCCVITSSKAKDPLINVLSSIKELIHDINNIVANTAPSRLYNTISSCVEEKIVGILSFLLLILENRKTTSHKQLANFLPMCTDTKQWFTELTRSWIKYCA